MGITEINQDQREYREIVVSQVILYIIHHNITCGGTSIPVYPCRIMWSFEDIIRHLMHLQQSRSTSKRAREFAATGLPLKAIAVINDARQQ